MGKLANKCLSKIIEDLVSTAPFHVFIETGTFKGDTALWASRIFSHVHTIEINQTFYDSASAVFTDVQRVNRYLGDSQDLLPKILPHISSHSIFWLDAHAGGGFYGDQDNCPLLNELIIINQLTEVSLLLIDDARGFLNPPPPPFDHTAWPNILSVLEEACGSGRRYPFIFDDVITCVPNEYFDLFLGLYHHYFPKI